MYQITVLLMAVLTFSACTKTTPPNSSSQSLAEPEEMCAEPEDSPTDSLNLHIVEPIDLIPEALGKLERPVTTTSQAAQDYFNQGLQLRYAFAVNQAASSFREAQKLDSTCAMCYWGEAWALGSYINEHMEDSKAPLAYRAIQKASVLSSEFASPMEQSLIEAMTIRYIENYVYDERRYQDSLYFLAMAEVYRQYPDDHDIATLYADALFMLEPRGGLREMDDPELMIIHDVLEKVLDENIEHPGACHLYIHATESSPHPELAAPCAAYLGNAIPGASHINHMPSHTYNEIGDWGKAVRANLQAWHSDQKAEAGKAFAIYPSHNLHMLLYSAAYDGQGAIAMQAGKDHAKFTENNGLYLLTLIRFSRYDEILEIEERSDSDFHGGVWDFAQGYARLKAGDSDFAEVYAKRVLQVADTTEAVFRRDDVATILQVLGTILQGEILRENGQLSQAVNKFKAAVDAEDSMSYNEPEPLPFSARHWLGNTLLEAGRYKEAENVFNAELEDHPKNGWSLFGLTEALRGQQKDHQEASNQFKESWVRADIWLMTP